MTDTVAAFDIKADLGPLLRDLKAFEPALARQTRARLRRAGDSTIANMRVLLEEYEGGTVTSWNKTVGVDKRGRARIRRTTANTQAAKRSRSRGSRRAVADSLKVRVSTGKRGTSIRLTSSGGVMRTMLNKASWRHPVFDSDSATWVEQPGARYFSRAIWGHWEEMRQQMEDAVQDAINAVADNRGA